MRQSPSLAPSALLPCLLLALWAAPVHAQDAAEESEEDSQRRAVSHSGSLGLDPRNVQRGATALPESAPGYQEEGGEIEFSSTGFIRVPARVSIGKAQHVDP